MCLVQSTGTCPSNAHVKPPESSSLVSSVNEASVSLVYSEGPHRIETTGGVVSTVHVVTSVFEVPERRSVPMMVKVCTPSARPLVVRGLTQILASPPSVEQV